MLRQVDPNPAAPCWARAVWWVLSPILCYFNWHMRPHYYPLFRRSSIAAFAEDQQLFHCLLCGTPGWRDGQGNFYPLEVG